MFRNETNYVLINGVQTDLTDTPYFSDNGLQINACLLYTSRCV